MLKIGVSLSGGTKGYRAEENEAMLMPLSRSSAYLAHLLGAIMYK
jgi:hypothetical protein